MNIFVAGATGAVGRLLLPMLAKAGHKVTAMTRNIENLSAISSLGAHGVVADALDREAVSVAVAQARPDVIIHQLTSLASRNFADNSRIHVLGTRHLVDAALLRRADRRPVSGHSAGCGPWRTWRFES